MTSEIKKLAMIGCGAMGGGMALLFAENGCDVLLQDPSNEAMDKVLSQAEKDGISGKVSKYQDYATLCAEFRGERKVFVWSLPHGDVGDKVLGGLMEYLGMGDVIIDAANEHWENCERRMGKCVTKGIRYVGMGVSGGYQAARRGPSMCPGSDPETLDLVMPLLQKAAAKAPDGTPCVGKIGTGGAGHYCKMIHNGIEHGMMSAMAEAYGIMQKGLGMSLDEIGNELHRWNKEGELQGTFLVRIGAEICLTEDDQGRVMKRVGDKVVQDWTGEEGTGIWSNLEGVEQHVPAPTLSAAHFLRIASGDLHQRRLVKKTFGGDYPPQKLDVQDKQQFLEDLRLAVFNSFLCSYVQGMNIIDKADKQKHFNVDYYALLQIWRAGCIIQADYISSNLLMPIYKDYASKTDKNPLFEPAVAHDLKRSFGALKRVVMRGMEGDFVTPALSASLEYLKYQTSTELPTAFQEAQLDYFGRHMFDTWDDDVEGKPTEGKWHFEWKEA